MLFIPVLAVLVALSLGKPENYRLPKWTHFLYLPSALLFLLVLTNDLHQLVFFFPTGVLSTREYDYGIGYYVVLYLSGLDSISSEIYEAATLDGASAWQQVTRITLPLMKNILGITLVLLMSGTLAVTFTYSKIMTNGGPGKKSMFMSYVIYMYGFQKNKMGYAAAYAVIFFILVGIFTVVLFKTQKEQLFGEEE